MYCSHCGAEANGAYCPQCGKPTLIGPNANPFAIGSQTTANVAQNEELGEPSETPTFLGAWPMFWRKWRDGRTRASRTEFWYVAIWHLIIFGVVAGLMALNLSFEEPPKSTLPTIVLLVGSLVGILGVFYLVFSLWPWTNLLSRRLRDANQAAEFPVVVLSLWAFPLVFLYAGFVPPTRGPNRYGSPPVRKTKDASSTNESTGDA